MDTFITTHVVIAFGLLALGLAVASFPKDNFRTLALGVLYLYFAVLIITAAMGIAIGTYRHPTSISVFQLATAVAIFFAVMGAISLWRRPADLWHKPWQFWFINGLAGSLIATTVASLFFIALTYMPDFYDDNGIILGVFFFAIPISVGHVLTGRSLRKWVPKSSNS